MGRFTIKKLKRKNYQVTTYEFDYKSAIRCYQRAEFTRVVENDSFKTEKLFKKAFKMFYYLFLSIRTSNSNLEEVEISIIHYLAQIKLKVGEIHHNRLNFAEAMEHYLYAANFYLRLYYESKIKKKEDLCTVFSIKYGIAIVLLTLCMAHSGDYTSANEIISALVSEKGWDIDFASHKLFCPLLLLVAEYLFKKNKNIEWLNSCFFSQKTVSYDIKIKSSLLQQFSKILASILSYSENSVVKDVIKINLDNITKTIESALDYYSNNSIEELNVKTEILEYFKYFKKRIIDVKSFEVFLLYTYREDLKDWILMQIEFLLERVISNVDFDAHCDLVEKCPTIDIDKFCNLFFFVLRSQEICKFRDWSKIFKKLTASLNKKPDNDIFLGMALSCLGYSQKYENELEKAEISYTEALNIFKKFFKNIDKNIMSLATVIKFYYAFAMCMLGNILVDSSRILEARDHFLHGTDLMKQILSETEKMTNPDEKKENFDHFIPLYNDSNLSLAICEIELGNFQLSNDIISTLITNKRDDVNFLRYKLGYDFLVATESVLINEGITVDWMDKFINSQPYNFDYDWKDPKCRIAMMYIENGNPVKGIKLLLEYNNEFKKRYNYPYNLNAVYGIFCALLNIDSSNINEIPEFIALWLLKALIYFEVKSCSNFKNMRVYGSNCPMRLTDTSGVVDESDFKINSVFRLKYWRGFCILINNIFFLDDKEWRNGTLIDAIQLINIFIDFGYLIIVLNDVEGSDLLRILKNYASNETLTQFDSFICVALSHGDNGVIRDGFGKVHTREIVDLFCDKNCPILANKPKIFIFNSCRGTKTYEYDLNVAENSLSSKKNKCDTIAANNSLSENSNSIKICSEFDWHDILIWYSTIEGFRSYRCASKGSLFINKLIAVLNEYTYNSTSIMDLAKKVEFSFKSELKGESYKQVTSIETFGWSKEFYFVRNHKPYQQFDLFLKALLNKE